MKLCDFEFTNKEEYERLLKTQLKFKLMNPDYVQIGYFNANNKTIQEIREKVSSLDSAGFSGMKITIECIHLTGLTEFEDAVFSSFSFSSFDDMINEVGRFVNSMNEGIRDSEKISIFRVENKDGDGPYRLNNDSKMSFVTDHAASSSHPTFGTDSELTERVSFHKSWSFGFSSFQQLSNWFNEAELTELHDNGFHIKEYLVPRRTTSISKYQAIFKKEDSKQLRQFDMFKTESNEINDEFFGIWNGDSPF